MRAVEFDKYGGPEELHVRTVPRPEPRAGEVLVRVHGTSVNPVDVTIRSGRMKLMSGRRFPKRWSPRCPTTTTRSASTSMRRFPHRPGTSKSCAT